MQEKVNSVIELEMSHIQVHSKDFRDEYLAGQIISNSEELIDELRGWDLGYGIQGSETGSSDETSNTKPQSPDPKSETEIIKAVSSRIVSMMMIASPNKNGAVKVLGVDPTDEAAVSVIDEKIIEGSFFENAKRNPIIISSRLAEDYKVKLRSKLVLTFQDVDNEITAGAFRVHGIFDTKNGVFDDTHVYVRRSDINKLMKVGDNVHEIAILLNEHEMAEPLADELQAAFPDLEIKAWLDLQTGMRYMIEAMDTYLYWIVGIILLALLFSIVNTMLMAVLERVREIGMLMAIGMTKGRIFMMIMLETVFLSMIGGPVGLFIAYTLVNFFAKTGINVSAAAYGEMGFGQVIHPYLETQSYWSVTYMVLIMAIIAAIYPAIKALRLNSVEAIRKI